MTILAYGEMYQIQDFYESVGKFPEGENHILLLKTIFFTTLLCILYYEFHEIIMRDL